MEKVGIIYKIINKINNKSYIGLTTSTLNKRFTQHKWEANHNTNRPLYKAMRKYGIENFDIEQIDDAKTLEELKQKEQYYIKFYNTYGANGMGYNATLGGDMTIKTQMKFAKINIKTGDIIEILEGAADNPKTQNADKITQTQYVDYVIVKYSNIENKTPEEIKKYAFSLRPKIICQLDKNNNLIARYINSNDVIKNSGLHISKSCLFDCLHNRRKTHLQYKWQYYQDLEGGDDLSDMQA